MLMMMLFMMDVQLKYLRNGTSVVKTKLSMWNARRRFLCR